MFEATPVRWCGNPATVKVRVHESVPILANADDPGSAQQQRLVHEDKCNMTGLYQTMPDSDGETTRTFAYIEYPETGWIETDKIMIGEEAKPMMSSSASSESAIAKEAETEIVRNLYEMLVIMSEQQPKHLRPWLFDHFRTKRVAKKANSVTQRDSRSHGVNGLVVKGSMRISDTI